MKKVQVSSKINDKTWEKIAKTEQEANSWIEKHKTNNTFGKSVRWVREDLCSPQDIADSLDERDIVEEDSSRKEYKLDQEYNITISDYNDWKEKRQEAYPSLSECVHAILDGGQTLEDLQALRQAIKVANPKPE